MLFHNILKMSSEADLSVSLLLTWIDSFVPELGTFRILVEKKSVILNRPIQTSRLKHTRLNSLEQPLISKTKTVLLL